MDNSEIPENIIMFRDKFLKANDGRNLLVHSETGRFFLIVNRAKDSITFKTSLVLLGLYGNYPLYTRLVEDTFDEVNHKGALVRRFEPVDDYGPAIDALTEFLIHLDKINKL